MKVNIYIATSSHVHFANAICELYIISAQERRTGIAKRTPEYITQKIEEGKAVIALSEEGELAGFSYIECWGHSQFVANSGLVVAHKFRKTGLARAIKVNIFELSRKLYPNAMIFSITTGLPVMKLNTELGYHPVTFSELTDDPEFWAGCDTCRNVDILKRNDYKMCLCYALLYNPKIRRPKSKLKHVTQVEIDPEKQKRTRVGALKEFFYPLKNLLNIKK